MSLVKTCKFSNKIKIIRQNGNHLHLRQKADRHYASCFNKMRCKNTILHLEWLTALCAVQMYNSSNINTKKALWFLKIPLQLV